jgi:hypothetical protein
MHGVLLTNPPKIQLDVMRLDNKPLERYWMPAPNQDIKKYINF